MRVRGSNPPSSSSALLPIATTHPENAKPPNAEGVHVCSCLTGIGIWKPALSLQIFLLNVCLKGLLAEDLPQHIEGLGTVGSRGSTCPGRAADSRRGGGAQAAYPHQCRSKTHTCTQPMLISVSLFPWENRSVHHQHKRWAAAGLPRSRPLRCSNASPLPPRARAPQRPGGRSRA